MRIKKRKKIDCLICVNELLNYRKGYAQAHQDCLQLLLTPRLGTDDDQSEQERIRRPVMPYDCKIKIGEEELILCTGFRLEMIKLQDPIEVHISLLPTSLRVIENDGQYIIEIGNTMR